MTEIANSAGTEAQDAQREFLKVWMRRWAVALACLILLTVAGFIWWEDQQIVLIPTYILAAFLSFWLIHFWYNRFVPKGIAAEQKKNPYRKIFFSAVNALSLLLLLAGVFGAFLILAADDGNPYNAIALVISLIWAVIFLRYFVWAVYYYNINYGLTDKDWEKIFEAREKQARGQGVPEGATESPDHNPFRSQTFGLPPGTVRGMIAFTLLFGAVALMVVSMGMEGQINENSFFWDHFEFFKTAFLMMIAFYFGDRSLKYLSKRWPQAGKAQGEPDQVPRDDVETDDAEFVEEDRAFAKDTGQLPSPSVDVDATRLKKLLQQDRDEPVIDELSENYLQIKDREFSKVLTDEQVESALERYKLRLQSPVFKAIIEVEGSGSGFLPDGRAKILFEGQLFWKALEKFKLDPKEYLPGNEDILYPSWTRARYKGGGGEYERLHKAMNIHKQAAVYACSWGKFQILGQNLEDNIKERLYDHSSDANKKDFKPDYYEDWADFYIKQQESEFYHLLDFIVFIKTKAVNGTPLIELIAGDEPSQYKWAKFAYGYNGSGYQKNSYDIRLQRAYERFKNA